MFLSSVFSSLLQGNKNTLFRSVQQMAYSLIEYRSQIVSGTLPKDDLVELKKKVTTKIDYGNRWVETRDKSSRTGCVCVCVGVCVCVLFIVIYMLFIEACV